jgi:hypothetical protein
MGEGERVHKHPNLHNKSVLQGFTQPAVITPLNPMLNKG